MELSILPKKSYSLGAIGKAPGKDHLSLSGEMGANNVNRAYDPIKRLKRKRQKYQGMKIKNSPKLEKGYSKAYLSANVLINAQRLAVRI